MFTTLIVFQVLVAMGLIAIVLVQRGPGATMGAAFGSGASGTVFGSRGAGNFLTRTTSWLALGFFGISLSLAILATGLSGRAADPESALSGSVIEQQEESGDAESAIDSALQSLDRPEDGAEPADDTQAPPAEAAAGDEADAGAAMEPAAEQEQEQTDPEPPSGP